MFSSLLIYSCCACLIIPPTLPDFDSTIHLTIIKFQLVQCVHLELMIQSALRSNTGIVDVIVIVFIRY